MTEHENVAELLKLSQENPELPIVPMVDAEITGDDYGYYAGSWGKATVDEYIVIGDYIAFKNDDDIFDVLERHLSREEFENLPEDDEECRPIYDALPWTKAIIVYITTP
ncbi:MAG: hypothetical protein LUF80_00555 [Oscillospiraceae bacterium]|nr:hypothetical protein [Oscillospiraceae bacterium]